MAQLQRRSFVGWLVLTILNFVDLYLYQASLKLADVNEIWIMKSLAFTELMMIKLLMPAFVAVLLQSYTSAKLIKTLWILCGLYLLITIWNVVQFVL